MTLEKSPGSPLANTKVYAFSDSGTYLGLNAIASDTGQVSFDLPQGNYKFRADYLGYQFWTDALSMPGTSSHTLTIAHQDVIFTVQGQYQDAFAIQGVKTYLFTGSGSYQGISATTNADGQVTYSLPEKAYKIRADYITGKYWSEQTIQTHKTIAIDHGKTLINVTQSDNPISGARVYLFSDTGSYLGQSANTDATGSAGFILPVKTYKFRIDHGGSQYWSPAIDLIAGQETTINLDLDSLALNLTANPHYARYDGEMPQKEDQEILLASIGSLAGYVDTSTSQPGVSYYINDHLGSPIKIVDGDGKVVWDGAYLPFGRADTSTSDAQNQFRFPGQYYDGETGLHYNWHRYYDPDTGRYLTPDPIGLVGGINPFVYSLNNPINFIDPLGLDTLTRRLNLTFIFGDITIGRVTDDKGKSGVLFSAAFGFSSSVGVTLGETTTNAPTIHDLEGWGTAAGIAAGSPLPFVGGETNRVTTGRPYENAYIGTDWGIGLGIGLPLTGQAFTGITSILFKEEAESKNVLCD